MNEGLPRVRFLDAVQKAFSNYKDYNGRSRRSEYWFFGLFVCFVLVTFEIVFFVLSLIIPPLRGIGFYLGFVILIPCLPFSIPLGVRRLHDIGKTGYFMFLLLIPIVGFYILYLASIDSVRETNEHGPSPKYSNADPSSLTVAE